MVAVTEALQQAAGDGRCLVTECSEARCKVPLTGLPNPHVVMSLEHSAAPIDRSKPRCDYLVAYQETNSAAYRLRRPAYESAGAAVAPAHPSGFSMRRTSGEPVASLTQKPRWTRVVR